MLSLLKYEQELWNKGINLIAGIDEVGRGAFAGPLVVGAVILNPKHLSQNYDIPQETWELYTQINDSKLLSAKKREKLSKFIQEIALSYSIAIIESQVIDRIGIMQATQDAFFEAVTKLTPKAQHILTDTFELKKLTQNTQTNIKTGDKLSITIAAASIIAKVFRDSLMVDLHNRVEEYQKYGFDKHKGYGTKAHIEALQQFGPCDIHRRSFEPIKSMLT